MQTLALLFTAIPSIALICTPNMANQKGHLFSVCLKSIFASALSCGNRLLLSPSSWQPPWAYAWVVAHPERGKLKATIHCYCMPKIWVGVRYIFLVLLVLTRSHCESTSPYLYSLLISCSQPCELCDVGSWDINPPSWSLCAKNWSSHKACSRVGNGFCSFSRVVCKLYVE